MEEIITDEEVEKYFKEFEGYVLNKWEENGTVVDREDTKFHIEIFTHLMSFYRERCLIKTIVELYELQESFDEMYFHSED